MAGLAAAWELSREGWRREFESITIIERSPHPGGKAASVRGEYGRIEEHGLHVWLGYYDNAFALMRECYDELDRASTDPAAPIRTWRDAFRPSDAIGVAQPGAAGWDHWIASFATNDLLPGDRSARGITPSGFVDRAVGLLWDLLLSLDRGSSVARSSLSTSAEPAVPLRHPEDVGRASRQLEVAALAAGSRVAQIISDGQLGSAWAANPIYDSIISPLRGLQRDIDRRLDRRPDHRRLTTIVDLVATAVRGVLADGLLSRDRAFTAADDEDFREWLARHGARPATLDSGIVRGMYDLVFAYEDGDPARPRFAAGQGLELASRFFFDYKGAIFWKMTAGMGDVVIAPTYEVLRRRGVRFELGCEVERLELAPDRPRLAAVHLRRSRRRADLDPLVRVGSLPVFGSMRPPSPATTAATLRVGREFDVVVLATSIAAIPLVAPDLSARDERWERTVREVRTVATRSAQVWFTESELDLGLPRADLTSSGWGPPFDTYASMSHLLPHERWTSDPPRGLAYLCGVLPDTAAIDAVDRDLSQHLNEGLTRLLPGLADRDGGPRPGAIRATFTTSPTHPSDRYVQALPGSRSARLSADGSGVDGLVLAGDWTRTGLDAGCIEAAVISGVRAANVVRSRDIDDNVVGGWSVTEEVFR
jgi:uncharacterized protein with NAD-binding domain and iron-sulfur cluster